MSTDSTQVDARPVEILLVGRALRRGILYVLTLIPLFWLLRGLVGAWSAGLGIAIVVGNLWLAGVMLSLGFRVSLGMYHAAAIFGFFLRLGLIMGSMLLIDRVVAVDRTAFGISVVVSFILLLGMEMMAMLKGKERELEWSN